MLHIHNSLTGQKTLFTPRVPGQVGIYVCGMTVYDYCHIGHARVMVVFDVVVRYLRQAGYHVTYVRNITDIDDKIIRRAAENNETLDALTARYIIAMHEDADALGTLRPDLEPRATQSIAAITAMIQTLIDNGHAYQANNGDVYYDVSRFANYGKLSGKRLDDLRVGARVEIDEAKDDPLDFVLWKAAKPGDPSWPSPWGAGRPGWHIECSAMAIDCLGPHFDIHGGGMDLKFPHHENEIAQSEAATGCTFANLWMHNGFVQVNEEKMSKSLGNFFTVREALTQYKPEVLRYFILSSQYRGPLNYSLENLDNAKSALDRLYTALRGLAITPAPEENAYAQRFHAAMQDDFNTPEALAVLFELARDINRARLIPADDTAATLAATLRQLAGMLGILQGDPEAWFQSTHVDAVIINPREIEALIAQRRAARERKDWSASDRIRDQLNALGVTLEDSAQGTTWRSQ